jgi:hypothetical protein
MCNKQHKKILSELDKEEMRKSIEDKKKALVKHKVILK